MHIQATNEIAKLCQNAYSKIKVMNSAVIAVNINVNKRTKNTNICAFELSMLILDIEIAFLCIWRGWRDSNPRPKD